MYSELSRACELIHLAKTTLTAMKDVEAMGHMEKISKAADNIIFINSTLIMSLVQVNKAVELIKEEYDNGTTEATH